MVKVTAPDSIHLSVYQITQRIEANALLRMIYVDSVELRGFEPDRFDYTYILQPGVQTLDLVAVPMDSTSLVEYSVLAIEDTTYIFCTSADESLSTVYTLYVRYSDIKASDEPDKDDVAFVPVKGAAAFVAVTIRADVQVAVYDERGKLLLWEPVPVCDPNYVEVERDDEGHEYIKSVYPGANGVVFDSPKAGVPYIYVFTRSTTSKRFTRGGKIMMLH